MFTLPSGVPTRVVSVGALLVAAGWFAGVAAAYPQERIRLGEPGAAAAPKPAAKLPTVKFEMRDKPWPAVLEWLSDNTGVPVITINKPTGTFTFIAPRGGRSEYTLPEVVDIINDALVAQKLLLIRRTSSFKIIVADEKI